MTAAAVNEALRGKDVHNSVLFNKNLISVTRGFANEGGMGMYLAIP